MGCDLVSPGKQQRALESPVTLIGGKLALLADKAVPTGPLRKRPGSSCRWHGLRRSCPAMGRRGP